MTYKFGHIDPWWNDSFKTLDYIYKPRYTLQITGMKK